MLLGRSHLRLGRGSAFGWLLPQVLLGVAGSFAQEVGPDAPLEAPSKLDVRSAAEPTPEPDIGAASDEGPAQKEGLQDTANGHEWIVEGYQGEVIDFEAAKLYGGLCNESIIVLLHLEYYAEVDGPTENFTNKLKWALSTFYIEGRRLIDALNRGRVETSQWPDEVKRTLGYLNALESRIREDEDWREMTWKSIMFFPEIDDKWLPDLRGT